jgi:hypothetical protein
MYKFSHGRVNDLRIDQPNHGVLTEETIKQIESESIGVKDTYSLIKDGLLYRKTGNMIAVYAQVGNSLANNGYVDYYFKQ